MNEAEVTVQGDEEQAAGAGIPRWTPDFDINTFDLQAVFREAKAQKKSAGRLLKSLDYPVAKFISAEVPDFKASKSGEGNIPLTASSTAVDLSGDDFAQSAIEQMKAAAVGSTVFLNHEYDVPEDVYGKVAEAAGLRRQVFSPLAGKEENLYCLDLDVTPVGPDENPRAVQITNMLQKSKLKLGVSVTVLILEWKKRGDGGRTITKVFYIETSMVGIPCNQTAWAQQSSKSFAKETVMEVKEETNQKTAADASRKVASFFNDEYEERTTDPWFLLSTFYLGLMDLFRQVRSGGVTPEAATALLDEAFDELKSKGVPAIAPKFEALAEADSTAGYDWYYYSALSRVAGTMTQKAGVPASGAEQELLNLAHDRLVETGAACAHKGAQGDVATKQASAAGAELESKHTQLETKVAALEEEKSGLAAKNLELEEKLTKMQEDFGLLEATATSMLAGLEAVGSQPMPRAGQVSVSSVR